LRQKAESGYRGRVPVAEFMAMDDTLRPAVLRRADASELARIYGAQTGFRPMRAAAGDAIATGLTDADEVRRVLGDPA
jgi:type II secretory ATPase GspE/PulE/Tfp pilus assembly ATPase PilB-like protein